MNNTRIGINLNWMLILAILTVNGHNGLDLLDVIIDYIAKLGK